MIKLIIICFIVGLLLVCFTSDIETDRPLIEETAEPVIIRYESEHEDDSRAATLFSRINAERENAYEFSYSLADECIKELRENTQIVISVSCSEFFIKFRVKKQFERAEEKEAFDYVKQYSFIMEERYTQIGIATKTEGDYIYYAIKFK